MCIPLSLLANNRDRGDDAVVLAEQVAASIADALRCQSQSPAGK